MAERSSATTPANPRGKPQTRVSLLGPQELRGDVQRIVEWYSIPDPESGTVEVGEAPLNIP
jgi:hypothetical protein